MNDDIIRMAREAGIGDSHGHIIAHELPNLKRFAELVRADEREACAKLCDEARASRLAEQIRARGNT